MFNSKEKELETALEQYSAGLLGVREWHLTPGADLCSIGLGATKWTPGENIAICKSEERPHITLNAPVTDCECGLYAYYQLNEMLLRKNISYNKASVLGIVIGRGKVELHENGFRSERMSVIGLIRNGNALVDQAIEKYNALAFNNLNDLNIYIAKLNKNHNLTTHNYQNTEDNYGSGYKTTLNSFGEPHSFNDEPAVIHEESGLKEWRQNGLLHREGDRPALTISNWEQYWQNGFIYREGGKPAGITSFTGGKYHSYYNKQNQEHRDGGKPALISIPDPGFVSGYYHGFEKLEEPQGYWNKDDWKIFNEKKSRRLRRWMRNGKFHRTNGPATINPDGNKEYWIDGIRLDRFTWAEQTGNEVPGFD